MGNLENQKFSVLEPKKSIWKKILVDRNTKLFLVLSVVYFVAIIAWGSTLWNQQTNLELGAIFVFFFMVIINIVYALFAGILSWRSFKNIEIAVLITWLAQTGFEFLLDGGKGAFSLIQIDSFFSISMLPIYIIYAIIFLVTIVRKVIHQEQRHGFFRILASPVILLIIFGSAYQISLSKAEGNKYDQQAASSKFKKEMLVLERKNQETRPSLIKEIENWNAYKKSSKKITGNICLGSEQRFIDFIHSINNGDIYELTIKNNLTLYTHNTEKYSNGLLKREQNGLCGNPSAEPLHIFDDKIIWEWGCEKGLNPTDSQECADIANDIISYYQNMY